MRYRALSFDHDYLFGQGLSEFLANSPAAVGQAVRTRLELAAGEWFVDLREGTPYSTEILGAGTLQLYDAAFKARILETPGVQRIDEYASVLNEQRHLTVQATITTIYGRTSVTATL